MKIERIRCPNCGAVIEMVDGRNLMFCSYCGTQICMTDENTFTFNVNTTYTERTIDEARIREAEAREAIKIRQMEAKERIRLRKLDLERNRVRGSHGCLFGIIRGFAVLIWGLLMMYLIGIMVLSFTFGRGRLDSGTVMVFLITILFGALLVKRR